MGHNDAALCVVIHGSLAFCGRNVIELSFPDGKFLDMDRDLVWFDHGVGTHTERCLTGGGRQMQVAICVCFLFLAEKKVACFI